MKLLGAGPAELAAPAADRFIAHLDAALGEQFFDITMAQVETEVQPDRVADDLGREAMAPIQGGVDEHPPILPGPPLINLSTPRLPSW